MAHFYMLVNKLEKAGKELFWHGKTSVDSIERLEELLCAKLPESYRHFLAEYGGGGLVGEEISGIEDNDAALNYRGTVLGDTNQCRDQFDLPSHLVVIYIGGDDVVWCLDTSAPVGAEFPVVSFDVNSRVIRRITDSFEKFFEEYVSLRVARE